MSKVESKVEVLCEKKMDAESTDDRKLLRVVKLVYFGYLVGKLREVLEASITDEIQLRALSAVMMDRMYEWWNRIGDTLTEEEWKEASKKHQ